MKVLRDPAPMLARTVAQWGGRTDLWIFAYASLIWRPDFEVLERRPARIHGWHRSLKMWSHINRGTPENPGLVFALLSGGSCHGMALRVASNQGLSVLDKLWEREMITGVYDPKWIACQTSQGTVPALAFTLSRKSPSFTGALSAAQYQRIFSGASGRYGSTLDYAQQTFECLQGSGIHDKQLAQLLKAGAKVAGTKH
jgi:glutathione-specific gamma-glutamylcyclotransferase